MSLVLTKEQAVELLSFIRSEVDETLADAIDSFANTGRVVLDPSDTMESLLDLGLLAGTAMAAGNPIISATIMGVGESAKDFVVSAVQRLEDKRYTPDRLRERIARAEAKAARATAVADKLASTEKVEVFEEVRIAASRRRARNQTALAETLRAQLPTE